MQGSAHPPLDIILYDCGWGCGDYGTQDGPHACRPDTAAARLSENGSVILSDLKIRGYGRREAYETKYQTFPMTCRAVEALAARTHADTQNGVVPVVLGGDHSSAIGTWSGVVSALEMEGDFGLVWIDAHMDAHTPETSEQGKWGGWWHGMPVASLTGEGAPEFTDLINDKVKIKPEHIVMIGIRSFEPGEEDYLKTHNIKYYHIDEVKRRGFATVFEEALTHVRTNCRGYGLSIDLDGFDPEDAPGVGTPEETGVRTANALKCFEGLGLDSDFHGLEIVEYNPHNDEDKKTATLIHNLIDAFFLGQKAD